ncbi:Crp/Fnr family transcriptional regulator [Sphingomonas solaris]|uniref:Crp/Fnr family transcriptional regulator n=1 Tax=Alterirhizorhabdus solaris TaxID=2529389 RepID=A0A558QV63_9SPHN|nr:Crp/Fnr family transcriptional regulator [Sphingomonas solaris]TVV71024.1 Crp/Fnr family transcriptional regulator [Sphingomonas solaris]
MPATMNRLALLPLDLPPGLRAIATERRFDPHTELFLQGHPATEIFGILAGRVTLWRVDESGAPCTLLLLGKGELLGSVSVAQGAPHLTSATALDRVTAVCWPAQLFRETVRQDSGLAQSFLQAVARRAVQLMDRFDDIAGLDVEARLARLLLRLCADFGQHDDDLAVVIDIRQHDLAELAFTTVPTVSRVLSKWRADGIASTQRGQVTIPHLSRLAARGGVHLD